MKSKSVQTRAIEAIRTRAMDRGYDYPEIARADIKLLLGEINYLQELIQVFLREIKRLKQFEPKPEPEPTTSIWRGHKILPSPRLATRGKGK